MSKQTTDQATALIELSTHGESKIVLAGGEWLVNQHGDFSPACAARVNDRYSALLAVASAAKALSRQHQDQVFICGSDDACDVDKSTGNLSKALANLAAVMGGRVEIIGPDADEVADHGTNHARIVC